MKGDYTPGKTVIVRFNTHKADGTPITLAGTPAISVYKNSTTESTAGVSLTVDYDSRTGLHHVVIDTSADGTFYAAGNDFDVVITAGTVDSISVVGTVVGSFSLSNRSALRPTTADRTLDVSAGGEAGIDWANVGSPTATVSLSGTTVGTVSSLAANSVNASALATDAVTEIQSGLASSASVAAIKAKTDLMNFSPVNNNLIVCIAEMYDNVGEYWPTGVTDPGYLHVEIRSSAANSIAAGAIAANAITNTSIANGALTSAKFSVSSITGVASGILEQIVQLWRLFFKKSNLDLNAAQLKTYADDGTTVLTTQTVTPSGTSQTRGAAT